MDVSNEVPVCICHVLEADIAEDTGVVDKDIDPTKDINGRLYDLLAVEDIVIVGDSLSPGRFDLIHHEVGSLRW